MGVTGENLAGEYFIPTGSGKYILELVMDPEAGAQAQAGAGIPDGLNQQQRLSSEIAPCFGFVDRRCWLLLKSF